MNNERFLMKNSGLLFAVLFLTAGVLFASPNKAVAGADAVPDLYSAALAPAGFSTTTGGAPVSAINPAQGGDARRMIFDASYLAIVDFGGGNETELRKAANEKDGYVQALTIGALFPTKAGVFGGSIRYIGGFGDGIGKGAQFYYFPVAPTFNGNLFASKEIYPGMSLGLGINFGFGAETTIAGDLGFRYNAGDLAFLKNFTIGVVIGGLGVSYFPSWFTPKAGVSFDLIHVQGKNGKADPFALGLAADISFPSLFYFDDANFIFKAGLNLRIAEVVTIAASWPGGSGFNAREIDKGMTFPVIPAIGITFNFVLPSGGERIAGGRLPSDGDLKISGAYKPLYEGITAVGGGVSWYVGVADKKAPVADLKYPEPAYFSPNNDGKADTLEIPISITDQGYVTSWSVEIKNERGETVRVIENKEQRFEQFNMKEFFKRIFSKKNQIDIPNAIVWDGLTTSGALAPDGRYTFTVTAADDSGNTATTQTYEAVLKNTPPNVSINTMTDAQKIFDPKAQGGNSSVTITPRGSAEDAWESAIFDAAGQRVRTFEKQNGAPRAITWDGRNDGGMIAPDGVYSFRIAATDKAQNSAEAGIANIILDSREAGAFVTCSVSAIRPERNQSSNLVNFAIRLSLTDGISNWKLELKDNKGSVQRTFSGTTQAPTVQGWNGLNEQGEIVEGVYTPELTVNYVRGDVVKASATTVLVDITGPELTFVSTPEYFSPDNDGENDMLFINLTARDASPIASWVVEIREPPQPNAAAVTFRKIEGRGTPAARITWDGKSDKGELVQSAMFYPYTFTATDALGNSSKVEGRIGVDVLVIREGDRLKIQIPSIQFRPNYADFVDLPKEVVDENNRILRRIAQILNQFRDYRVQVEGHANATQPVGAARDREEPTLKSISEARARAIVDMLVRNGVARNRLTASGMGGSKPIVAFEDRDNWWKNRRVEFYLIK